MLDIVFISTGVSTWTSVSGEILRCNSAAQTNQRCSIYGMGQASVRDDQWYQSLYAQERPACSTHRGHVLLCTIRGFSLGRYTRLILIHNGRQAHVDVLHRNSNGQPFDLPSFQRETARLSFGIMLLRRCIGRYNIGSSNVLCWHTIPTGVTLPVQALWVPGIIFL